MGQNLRVDSYEPYVFGLKLGDIDIGTINKKFREILPTMNFEVPPLPPNMPFSPGPIQVVGIKDGTELKINFDSNSILIESNKPHNVKNLFEEVRTLFELVKLDMDDSIVFYEIISNVVVESDKNPRKIINNSCHINTNNLSDLDTFVSGIKINSLDTDGKKLISLIIEPRAGNPKKFYFVNFVYRTDDPSDLIGFHDKVDEKIKEVINSLED